MKVSLRQRLRSATNRPTLNRWATAIAVHLYRLRRKPAMSCDARVVLVFPTTRGSVGDEAMAIAASQTLRDQGCKSVSMVSFIPHQDWKGFHYMDEVVDAPSTPLGWIKFIRWLAHHDALGIIGADVLDGHYSPARSKARLLLAEIGSKLGLRTILLGFSYRDTPEQSSLDEMRRVGPKVHVFSRDPLSRSRLERMAGLNAIQVADLAFLLKPASSSPRLEPLSKWISQAKGLGNFVLGINCNSQALDVSNSETIAVLVNTHARAIAALTRAHPAVTVVLIPHDSRGNDSDVKVCERIFQSLDEAIKPRTYLIDELWSAPELKSVASRLDAAIAGRMHFAIACLGSGTPVAGFEYQDKFAGLYDLFGLRELCRSNSESLKEQELLLLMEKLYNEADSFRSNIAARLPEVRSLAHRNVAALLGTPGA